MIRPPTILIRCDGSSEMGMGHLLRSEAIACALRALHSCEIELALRGSDAAAARLERSGWTVHRLPCETEAAAAALCRHAAERQASAVVFDVRDPVPQWSLEQLRERPVVLALIDDESPMRLAMDLTFGTPMPQVLALPAEPLRGTHHVGWEWVPLRAEFAIDAPTQIDVDGPLLVCMGGSDPACMTEQALRALERVEALPEITVVIGELFAREAELRASCARSLHTITVRRAVDDMAGLMRAHGFALASFGVIAYELAAVGLPALYLSLTPDHALCASALERCGVARHVGVYDRTDEDQIARAVIELRDARAERRAMSDRGRALIDGRGARRIAAAILECVEKRDG